jgi:nucleotide-binding universal stress UspA family protein
MNIQHILVPLDFSADAEQAFNDALGLAQPLQARLTLLHVIYMPVAIEESLSVYLAEMESSAEQEMARYQQRVKDAGITAETVIVCGTPFREIIEVARTQQVDLIIMGTHGRTGMKHLLIGSVAERVVRLAPCPVMVTRHHD